LGLRTGHDHVFFADRPLRPAQAGDYIAPTDCPIPRGAHGALQLPFFFSHRASSASDCLSIAALAAAASDKKVLTCCALATSLSAYSAKLGYGWGAVVMFDVYLNEKRDLLVVRKGFPIPLGESRSRWRKKKKVAVVSDDICRAVQNQGYYIRKLKEFKRDLIAHPCSGGC
jgi:hypothetical protein